MCCRQLLLNTLNPRNVGKVQGKQIFSSDKISLTLNCSFCVSFEETLSNKSVRLNTKQFLSKPNLLWCPIKSAKLSLINSLSITPLHPQKYTKANILGQLAMLFLKQFYKYAVAIPFLLINECFFGGRDLTTNLSFTRYHE